MKTAAILASAALALVACSTEQQNAGAQRGMMQQSASMEACRKHMDSMPEDCRRMMSTQGGSGMEATTSHDHPAPQPVPPSQPPQSDD